MDSLSPSFSFAILIATRNRPESLDVLLGSIRNLVLRPEVLIVVSSGKDVSHITAKHHQLKIKHQHILERGQIRQKMIGVSEIPNKIHWVLFLDDDLVLEPTATLNLLKFLSTNPDKSSIIGLGLADSIRNNAKQPRFQFRSKFGTVSKSGKNYDYTFSKVPIQTSWLNGASMWRRDHASKYFFEYLESHYSICEDLIFSYSRSKFGNLYFIPEARFQFQSNIERMVDHLETFKARAYWKFYFVSTQPDLSVPLFLANQILASFLFAFRGSLRPWRIIHKLKFAFSILLDLVLSYIRKQNLTELMNARKI